MVTGRIKRLREGKMATGKTAKVVAKNIRVSPRKLNLLAQQIRGKKVQKALDILAFSEKRVAETVHKALRSVIANAENNHNMDIDYLVIDESYVGKALTLRRFQAKAKGRGVGIRKPFSHLTITVREQEA